MILSAAELDSLVQATQRSPHQLLGMHPLGDGQGVVVRAFLQNAASVATLLLTSDALIAEKPKDAKKGGGHGGHDDMY